LSQTTAAQLPENLEDFVLCTVHRAENTDNQDRLKNIFSALAAIHREINVVLLLHPRTKKQLAASGIEPQFITVEPVGYLEMLYLIERCRAVLTDSGGLQKEAFFLKKICLTLRDQTEWVELVENGVNYVVGTDREKIVETFRQAINKKPDFDIPLYGGGKAGEKIVDEIMREI
jgi:UDP-GlcNAc3NAcA epimerase